MRKAERKWWKLWHLFGPADKQGLKVNQKKLKGEASPSIYADWVNGGWF